MKSIGGYLGLELGSEQNSLLDDKYLFNSGRAACLCYLKDRGIQRLWLPKYICRDFVETLLLHDIDISFYNIDGLFEIQSDIHFDEIVLYVNYFGLKDDYIRSISSRYKKMIIDNSQAIFAAPVDFLPTFYSPRKFFGVPDGGMLYVSDGISLGDIPASRSYQYAQHLLKQIDVSIEHGFEDFKVNEKRIVNSEIAHISNLSKYILENIDVASVKKIRTQNFTFLKENLESFNTFTLKDMSYFAYPLQVADGMGLRNYLIDHQVYTPCLWADQLEFLDTSLERELIEQIVFLPIDQRYREGDMRIIVDHIRSYYA